jgi:spore germination protein
MAGLNLTKLRRAFASALILAGAACVFSSADAAPSRKIMAYYGDSSSLPALKADTATVDQLPTDSFVITGAGAIHGSAPKQALAIARANKMQTFATISNYGATDFSPSIVHMFLHSPAAVNAFIDNVKKLLSASGYSGVNIDFEAIPPGDRAVYTSFCTALYKAMHADGRLVALSIPAMQKDDPSDSWAGAYHLSVLGKVTDIVQFMTYDENGPWGAPGPVSGLDWVAASVKYAAGVVPSSKVSLGLPAYGYDWNLTAGTGGSIDWKAIPALLKQTGATAQWDAKSSSPYFHYTASNGAKHVVWYENARSITAKSRLVPAHDLAGVSVWVLGADNADYWKAIHAAGF